jgi:hypothetical protein
MNEESIPIWNLPEGTWGAGKTTLMGRRIKYEHIVKHRPKARLEFMHEVFEDQGETLTLIADGRGRRGSLHLRIYSNGSGHLAGITWQGEWIFEILSRPEVEEWKSKLVHEPESLWEGQ